MSEAPRHNVLEFPYPSNTFASLRLRFVGLQRPRDEMERQGLATRTRGRAGNCRCSRSRGES